MKEAAASAAMRSRLLKPPILKQPRCQGQASEVLPEVFGSGNRSLFIRWASEKSLAPTRTEEGISRLRLDLDRTMPKEGSGDLVCTKEEAMVV